MKIAAFSIHRPITMLMIFFGIFLLGIISLKNLPVELMPNVAPRKITIIQGIRGGLPPTEVENLYTKIIEDALSTVMGLQGITSTSEKGKCTVVLRFKPGHNMDFAALEVREKFAKIKNKLPQDREKEVIAKYEESDIPVMILAVTSLSDNQTPETLRKLVEAQVKDRLLRVEGVANVEIGGGREQKIIVDFDLSRLEAHEIDIRHAIDKIGTANVSLLVGEMPSKGSEKYLLRTIGSFLTLQEVEQTVIKVTPEGIPIRLKDIAKVSDSFLDPENYSRVDKQSVVSLYLQRESTANTVAVARGVLKLLDSIRKALPQDVRILVISNQAEFILDAINTVKSQLKYGALLAMIVLLCFLREFKTTMVVILAIPISVLITFMGMGALGISLNVMTLSGLALGVGMLTDNSVVVIENIFKKRKRGVDPITAATQGTDEMMLAIVSSTLTILVVFIPIVFVNPEIRMLYEGLAFTVSCSLIASLIVAISFVPLLASRIKLKRKPTKMEFAKEHPELEEVIHLLKSFFNFLAHQKGMILVVTIFLFFDLSIQKPLFVLYAVCVLLAWLKQAFPYSLKIPFPLLQRRTCWQMIFHLPAIGAAIFAKLYFSPTAIWLIILVFISFLFMELFVNYTRHAAGFLRYRYVFLVSIILLLGFSVQKMTQIKKEFASETEQGKFTIFVELPDGAKLDVSDKVVKEVEELLDTIPEIKTVQSRVEGWSSKVYVKLVPYEERSRGTEEIIEQLRPKVKELGKAEDAFIYFSEAQEAGGKELIVDVYGYDYDKLREMAYSIAEKVSEIKNLEDTKIRITEGRPEMQIEPDKKKLALFGFTLKDVADILHAQIRGLRATAFRHEAREIETLGRLDEKWRKNLQDLRKLTLITPSKKVIFLEQVAEFKPGLGPSEIWRQNKSRMIQVSASVGKIPMELAIERVAEVLKEVEFPKDYHYEFGGNFTKNQENRRQLSVALLLTAVLVYMVLACFFESYYQPFIIMITVPLALIGAIYALDFMNKSISMGVLIGAIMLIGIVVNNSIMLVDHVNLLQHRGYSLLRSVIEGGKDRLQPIMMTAMTNVLGFLPVALDKSEGANLWAPLAITVIGGLTSSTILTLFVIPSIYMVFEDVKQIRAVE